MSAERTSLLLMLLLAAAVQTGCARARLQTAAEAVKETAPVRTVHFGFDSARIGPVAAAGIKRNIEWMSGGDVYLILAGHCDLFGSVGYNLYLGDRRARAVKAYMIKNGVPEERILPVISYGKERPAARGRGRAAMAANRRVEFVVR